MPRRRNSGATARLSTSPVPATSRPIKVAGHATPGLGHQAEGPRRRERLAEAALAPRIAERPPLDPDERLRVSRDGRSNPVGGVHGPSPNVPVLPPACHRPAPTLRPQQPVGLRPARSTSPISGTRAGRALGRGHERAPEARLEHLPKSRRHVPDKVVGREPPRHEIGRAVDRGREQLLDRDVPEPVGRRVDLAPEGVGHREHRARPAARCRWRGPAATARSTAGDHGPAPAPWPLRRLPEGR